MILNASWEKIHGRLLFVRGILCDLTHSSSKI